MCRQNRASRTGLYVRDRTVQKTLRNTRGKTLAGETLGQAWKKGNTGTGMETQETLGQASSRTAQTQARKHRKQTPAQTNTQKHRKHWDRHHLGKHRDRQHLEHQSIRSPSRSGLFGGDECPTFHVSRSGSAVAVSQAVSSHGCSTRMSVGETRRSRPPKV